MFTSISSAVDNDGTAQQSSSCHTERVPRFSPAMPDYFAIKWLRHCTSVISQRIYFEIAASFLNLNYSGYTWMPCSICCDIVQFATYRLFKYRNTVCPTLYGDFPGMKNIKYCTFLSDKTSLSRWAVFIPLYGLWRWGYCLLGRRQGKLKSWILHKDKNSMNLDHRVMCLERHWLFGQTLLCFLFCFHHIPLLSTTVFRKF